jgi:L-asparagine transporter-like permease
MKKLLKVIRIIVLVVVGAGVIAGLSDQDTRKKMFADR